MSDNNNSRPISTGSQGTPTKNFSTNNTRSSNESYPCNKGITRTTDSKQKTVPTPAKKGK